MITSDNRKKSFSKKIKKAIPHDIALTGCSMAGANPCHSYTS